MQNHIKISPETIDSNVPQMNFHCFTLKIWRLKAIADLVFIFRLQNFTQEIEIYYIGSVLVVPSLFEIE
jgi:hypothetical protein